MDRAVVASVAAVWAIKKVKRERTRNKLTGLNDIKFCSVRFNFDSNDVVLEEKVHNCI